MTGLKVSVKPLVIDNVTDTNDTIVQPSRGSIVSNHNGDETNEHMNK